jgi:exosortase/archaeosortase family protein
VELPRQLPIPKRSLVAPPRTFLYPGRATKPVEPEGDQLEIAATSATRRAGLMLRPLLTRVPVKALVLVAAVALAYNYSLETLTRGLGLQTPLAYLALVPLIALVLGVVNFRVQPTLLPIHDRQLDWIVGLFLIGVAASIDLLLPSAYSADFWLHRIDMLGLPFFTAGMIAILWGVRRLWALRWAVAFLFLAWPDPYVTLLSAAIGTSTDLALAAVQATLTAVPVAQPLGDGTFLIAHGNDQFSLAVGSACSGINSFVGFGILGVAFNVIFRGSILRRILWLAAGLLLVGELNVLRIDLIFVAGWAFGEPFALDVLHPVAGIIVFGLGALVMMEIAPFFGLSIPEPPLNETAVPRKRKGQVPSVKHAAWSLRISAPMAVGLVLALLLAVPDASFAHYDSLVDAFGSPTLGAIDPGSLTIAGWQASTSTSFDQATSYFGPHATWERVAFTSTDTSASGPSSVYLDVIRTDDAGSLAAYGVEACYNFHGFSQVSTDSANVGAGVDAKVASFRSPTQATDWSILWWEWPYNAGNQTRYERLVLLAPLDSADQPGGTTSQSTFLAAQSTIESLARSIVGAGMSDTAPVVDPATQQ